MPSILLWNIGISIGYGPRYCKGIVEYIWLESFTVSKRIFLCVRKLCEKSYVWGSCSKIVLCEQTFRKYLLSRWIWERCRRAKTTLNSSIKKENYLHLLNGKTAQEVWTERTNWKRHLRPWRDTTYWLDTKDCWNGTLVHYVCEIISTAHTLNKVTFTMPDEWVAKFLLIGLTEKIGPMIMALENASDELKSDEVK